MTGFHQDWLALREPYDHTARDGELAAGLSSWLRADPAVQVMDLGCGTGSNLRYLAPRLPRPQTWHLVDNDSTLTDALARHNGFDAREHHVHLRDLTALHDLPIGSAHVVVASALMDLVSREWFSSLAGRCREAGAALLISLSYDGHMRWQPGLPDDAWIEAQFNAHQRGEKHFGPAMGPTANIVMSGILQDLGYRVTTAATPWVLGPRDGEIQKELLSGIAAACMAMAPQEEDRIACWSDRRGDLIREGHSHLKVGHGDLLALPPGEPT